MKNRLYEKKEKLIYIQNYIELLIFLELFGFKEAPGNTKQSENRFVDN